MVKMYVFCKSENSPKYWAQMYHAYMSGSLYYEAQNKVKVPICDDDEVIDILSIVFLKYRNDKKMLEKIFDLRRNLTMDLLYFVWEDEPDPSTAGRNVMHLMARINELYFMRRKEYGNQTYARKKELKETEKGILRDAKGRIYLNVEKRREERARKEERTRKEESKKAAHKE